MNLRDAELEERTGCPIVRGRLSIGTEADMAALGILEHDRLLLRDSLSIWPVTNVSRDEHGFCHPTLGAFGLYFGGLAAQDIKDFSSRGASQPFYRGGIHTGCLIRRKGLEQICLSTPLTPIHACELKAEYRPEGLHFAISGQFAGADGDAAAAQYGPDLNGKAYSVNAIIPSEILLLKGFIGHGHGTLASNDDSPDRPRDPRKLQDLLIDPVFGSTLVKGKVLLAPESALPRRQDQWAANFLHIVINQLGSESISVFDAPRVGVYDDGFATSSISLRSLTVCVVGGMMLEQEFKRQDSLSMQLAGGPLGQVGYAIDETERVFPNMVFQKIRTIALRMTLGEGGLQISADGDLEDLEPAQNPRYREHPNLRLGPVRTYSVSATVPWAFLAVRGFSFADRHRSF